jgi:hypothetical protein
MLKKPTTYKYSGAIPPTQRLCPNSILLQSHPRQWVDRSNPTYDEGTRLPPPCKFVPYRSVEPQTVWGMVTDIPAEVRGVRLSKAIGAFDCGLYGARKFRGSNRNTNKSCSRSFRWVGGRIIHSSPKRLEHS